MGPGRIVRAGAALGAVLAAAAAGRAGVEIGLAYLAPALALFAVLLARRYPGERHVARLVTRARRTPRPARATRPAARPRPARRRPRGGLLIASALAERGPPPLLLPH